MFKFDLLKDLIKSGGPMMWVILVCAVFALIVFLVKVFQFHRDEINVRELLHGLTNALKRDGIAEALTLCNCTPGPAARLLGAAILSHKNGGADMRKAIDEVALDELPKLERWINLLGTLGFILPLLGFLGTVLNMLEIFELVRDNQMATSYAINSTMSAFVSTAAGLTVAIPCYLGHNYLVSRVNTITLDMEKAALEITAFFARNDKDRPKNDDSEEA